MNGIISLRRFSQRASQLLMHPFVYSGKWQYAYLQVQFDSCSSDELYPLSAPPAVATELLRPPDCRSLLCGNLLGLLGFCSTLTDDFKASFCDIVDVIVVNLILFVV